jgi:hypothetical protein
MADRLPLSALLSQALVAFIFEFDNEFEHQVPHRTTNHGSTPGFPKTPWLVSMAMWVRYMQHIPEEGISFVNLQERVGISNKDLQTWLTRLGKWWGYLSITASASGRIASDATIRPTSGGIRAIRAWRPLSGVIEARWQERFGSEVIDQLKRTLVTVADRLDADIPNFFSVLENESPKRRAPSVQLTGAESTLPQLLARVLIAFAGDFDSESIAPLAACANVLRLTPDLGVRVRDLPRLASLSKEGIDASLRMSARHGCTVLTADKATRSRLLMLTPKGRRARDAYVPLTQNLEERWQGRFDEETIRVLRNILQRLAGSGHGNESPLMSGLSPYPDGWRASLPPLAGLPHFPMVSHRGGFPDGS